MGCKEMVIVWIRRMALIMGFGAFFLTLVLSLDSLGFSGLIPAILRSIIAGSCFWFAGFIIGDILIKGMVHDIANDPENLIEGGLLQQIHNQQVLSNPLKTDVKFCKEAVEVKDKKNREKKAEE